MADTARKVRVREGRWQKKESSYNNGIGDGEAGVYYMPYSGELWKDTPKIGNDRLLVGKNHGFAGTTRQVMAWDAEVSRNENLTSKTAGWAFGLGLGTVSTTSLGGGAYSHAFTPLLSSTSVQLPSTCCVEDQPDEGLKRRFYGVCLDSLSVSGAPTEWCQIGYQLRGSGKVDASSSLSFPADATTLVPIKFTGISTFTIGASASESTAISRLRNFKFDWKNNLLSDRGYQAGVTEVNDGAVRGRLEVGDHREHGLELTVDATRSAYAEWTAHRAQTLYGVTLTAVGTQIGASGQYHTVKIEIPELYSVADPQFDGEAKVYRLQYEGRYKSTNNGPVKVTVISDDATIMSAAA